MRILVVGGSGYVGGLVVPLLGQRYALRVFDPRPPAIECDHVLADATDYPALLAAMDGVDAVVHAAMGSDDGSESDVATAAFDVNVKSVYLTSLAAHRAGVPHLVHLSSLSVYQDIVGRSLDESTPPDACDLYGLTKRLGEDVCRAAARNHGMSVNILRLAWPTPDHIWPAWGKVHPPRRVYAPDGSLVPATAATDVAAAISAALEFRDGFQIFMVSGDRSGRWSTERARELLHWSPTFDVARDTAPQ